MSTKIKCGISENVREDGKCVHVQDYCGAPGHENICKNGSQCVNIDNEPFYDCVHPDANMCDSSQTEIVILKHLVQINIIVVLKNQDNLVKNI